MDNRLILVTGPARSGKSEWAEKLAARSGKKVIYVATAQVDPTDYEWQARIERHQQRRPADWKTLNVPVELAATILSVPQDTCLLVDSLGTWLANCLEQEDGTWNATVSELVKSLSETGCPIVIVAEEAGWGVVPAYSTGRRFRDRLGFLTQQIGAMADAVYLVTAGYALNLSRLGIPLEKGLGE
ncbi:MAG: bifunctional adenosylcobinamide kinase/adenosylcobinamide-phosphate guanylyltransferase [Leptolyngbyaceae cyanobacterium HOT.MB2.61]|jgi:adenosylcobinamide kinase/adenosylcobinamide-phosphate guanylyltransferase|nr:bifunctional adenosylcobinamide kinase/adenosylcobinamide-phosphate guanylyltransferase [Leptolyngbyaceae cyanobacterium HOT.MB2.61]